MALVEEVRLLPMTYFHTKDLVEVHSILFASAEVDAKRKLVEVLATHDLTRTFRNARWRDSSDSAEWAVGFLKDLVVVRERMRVRWTLSEICAVFQESPREPPGWSEGVFGAVANVGFVAELDHMFSPAERHSGPSPFDDYYPTGFVSLETHYWEFCHRTQARKLMMAHDMKPIVDTGVVTAEKIDEIVNFVRKEWGPLPEWMWSEFSRMKATPSISRPRAPPRPFLLSPSTNFVERPSVQTLQDARSLISAICNLNFDASQWRALWNHYAHLDGAMPPTTFRATTRHEGDEGDDEDEEEENEEKDESVENDENDEENEDRAEDSDVDEEVDDDDEGGEATDVWRNQDRQVEWIPSAHVAIANLLRLLNSERIRGVRFPVDFLVNAICEGRPVGAFRQQLVRFFNRNRAEAVKVASRNREAFSWLLSAQVDRHVGRKLILRVPAVNAVEHVHVARYNVTPRRFIKVRGGDSFVSLRDGAFSGEWQTVFCFATADLRQLFLDDPLAFSLHSWDSDFATRLMQTFDADAAHIKPVHAAVAAVQLGQDFAIRIAPVLAQTVDTVSFSLEVVRTAAWLWRSSPFLSQLVRTLCRHCESVSDLNAQCVLRFPLYSAEACLRELNSSNSLVVTLTLDAHDEHEFEVALVSTTAKASYHPTRPLWRTLDDLLPHVAEVCPENSNSKGFTFVMSCSGVPGHEEHDKKILSYLDLCRPLARSGKRACRG